MHFWEVFGLQHIRKVQIGSHFEFHSLLLLLLQSDSSDYLYCETLQRCYVLHL